MEIEFYDEDADRNSDDLVRWLRDEKIHPLVFERRRAALEPGGMGGSLLPVIQASLPHLETVMPAALSAPAVLLVIKSIGGWIKATRRKAKIKIICPNGAELHLETENNKNIDSKLIELSKLCTQAGESQSK